MIEYQVLNDEFSKQLSHHTGVQYSVLLFLFVVVVVVVVYELLFRIVVLILVSSLPFLCLLTSLLSPSASSPL